MCELPGTAKPVGTIKTPKPPAIHSANAILFSEFPITISSFLLFYKESDVQ
jgi:hypothetical protein